MELIGIKYYATFVCICCMLNIYMKCNYFKGIRRDDVCGRTERLLIVKLKPS